MEKTYEGRMGRKKDISKREFVNGTASGDRVAAARRKPIGEELAKKMEVPYEKFKVTVERYNKLARMGKDLDFGKHPECLSTIETAPLFAIKMEFPWR